MLRIAIDGPGGAGKSSVARAVARACGLLYVDTGALYRTVGLFAQRTGTDPKNADAVAALLPRLMLRLTYEDGAQQIYLGEERITDQIRTPEISLYASDVSAHAAVRAFLLDLQRDTARHYPVIMDGRDIGTVIFPDAELKIFLTASAAARAQRRCLELRERGIEADYETVLRETEQRDLQDSTRTQAPLRPAPDAVMLDSSDLTFEQTVEKVTALVRPLLPANKKSKKTKRSFYMRLHRCFAGLFRFLLRVRAEGLEHIPAEGGMVVCSNHISAFDILAVASVFPRQLRFLAKRELFAVPLLGSLLRACGVVPLDRGGRDVGAVRRSIALVKGGNLVAVFPQGHRYKGKNPADTPVKYGAGLIATHADAPMLPVCIKVKNNRYRFLRRVHVLVGQPISCRDLGLTEHNTAAYTAATQAVFSALCALGGFTPTADATASAPTDGTGHAD